MCIDRTFVNPSVLILVKEVRFAPYRGLSILKKILPLYIYILACYFMCVCNSSRNLRQYTVLRIWVDVLNVLRHIIRIVGLNQVGVAYRIFFIRKQEVDLSHHAPLDKIFRLTQLTLKVLDTQNSIQRILSNTFCIIMSDDLYQFCMVIF